MISVMENNQLTVQDRVPVKTRKVRFREESTDVPGHRPESVYITVPRDLGTGLVGTGCLGRSLVRVLGLVGTSSQVLGVWRPVLGARTVVQTCTGCVERGLLDV